MNHRVSCITQPGSIFCDYIKHRLDIRRRTGDDPQNFARRCLLFQRLTEVTVARVEFLEQPDVLDSDHCLVSKSLKELDLRRGEGPYLGATCAQRSNEFPLLT